MTRFRSLLLFERARLGGTRVKLRQLEPSVRLVLPHRDLRPDALDCHSCPGGVVREADNRCAAAGSWAGSTVRLGVRRRSSLTAATARRSWRLFPTPGTVPAASRSAS